MGGSSAYIDHADAIGSTAMETDPAGGLQWDIVYFPWGQIWQQTGTRQSAVWADLDWQVNDPLHPSATREYSGNVNRWFSPDPDNAGAHVGDSQSWNMYSYAGDNPTSRNDPSGEDYHVCVENGQGGQNCFDLSNEAFAELWKDPGPGISGYWDIEAGKGTRVAQTSIIDVCVSAKLNGVTMARCHIRPDTTAKTILIF